MPSNNSRNSVIEALRWVVLMIVALGYLLRSIQAILETTGRFYLERRWNDASGHEGFVKVEWTAPAAQKAAEPDVGCDARMQDARTGGGAGCEDKCECEDECEDEMWKYERGNDPKYNLSDTERCSDGDHDSNNPDHDDADFMKEGDYGN
ncbi:hypothetical protein BC834DRAFT_974794 [Gloeopeniophorella convolvens]|nr:hypothetical protein BC834DRAFT_974794 [Gloeopeniophorella convolvens]